MLERECKAFPNIITIRFNPWLAENKKLLITDFFDVLHERTGVYDAKLGKQILLYAKKLNQLIKTNYFALLEATLLYYSSSSLYKHYDLINQRIKKLGKKIIIFIDDIDRLDNEEVVEVLRIIRNTSSFNNTYFIVANDRKYVENAFIESKIYNPKEYIEKIFQLEFPLPPVKTEILINELYNLLLKYFKYEEKDIKIFFSNIKEIEISWNYYFKNIRDVKRFINAFIQYYPYIKTEVNFSDFFLVTLLRVYFNETYKELAKESKKYFFSINTSNINSISFSKEETEKGKQARLKSFIEDNNNFIEEEPKNNLKNLLETIFDDEIEGTIDDVFNRYDGLHEKKHDPSIVKSVRNPSNFNLYFNDNILNETITNSEFNSFLLLEKNTMLNCIDFLFNEENFKVQLEEKFLYYFTTVKDPFFDNWYLGYVYFLKKSNKFFYSGILGQLLTFKEKGERNHPELDQSRLNPTFNFTGLDKEKKIILFEQVFTGKYTSYSKGDAELLYNIRKIYYYQNDEPFFIEEKELLEMNLNLFKNYIEKYQNNFDQDILIYFYNCANSFNKKSKKITISEKANELLVKLANRSKKEFLNQLIFIDSPFQGEETFKLRPLIFEAFGGEDKFEEYLNNPPHKDHVIVKFYYLFKSNNYQSLYLSDQNPIKSKIMEIIEKR